MGEGSEVKDAELIQPGSLPPVSGLARPDVEPIAANDPVDVRVRWKGGCVRGGMGCGPFSPHLEGWLGVLWRFHGEVACDITGLLSFR